MGATSIRLILAVFLNYLLSQLLGVARIALATSSLLKKSVSGALTSFRGSTY